MAERGKRPTKPDLTPDAAAPAAGEPPDTVAIYGILGESHIASSVLLYLDVGLTTFYDIPIEGIVGREKVPAERSPLHVDSTLLFVRKGIRLVVHHRDERTVEQEFLAGDFTTPGTFVPARGLQAARGRMAITASEICSHLGCDTATIPPHSHLGCTTATNAVMCGSLGIACTIQGCGPRTIHPTIWTQIGCDPIRSAPGACPSVHMCPSIAGCPSEWCGDQGF